MDHAPIAENRVHDCYAKTMQDQDTEYELLIEQIQVMIHQEDTAYACHSNYTRGRTTSENSVVITEAWRQKICEWAFEVSDHFDYSRDVVNRAMNYLDRFVSSLAVDGVSITRKEYQLAAVACLHIAIKLEGGVRIAERQVPPLTIAMLVDLCRGIFSREAIGQMERTILVSLGWRMNPPTSLQFISYFLKIFHGMKGCCELPKDLGTAIFEATRYLSELSVCVSSLTIECKPSVIALASLYSAMECANQDYLTLDLRNLFMEHISNITGICTKSEEFQDVCATLKDMCPEMPIMEEYHVGGGKHAPNQNEQGLKAFETGDVSPVCVSGKTANRKRSFDSR